METSPLIGLLKRHIQVMAVDVVVIVAAYYALLNFRYAGTVVDWEMWTADFAFFAAVAIAVHLAVNRLTGVYRIMGRYMSLAQAVRVAQAGIISICIIFIVVLLWPILTGGADYLVPRSVLIGGGVAATICMIGWRFSRRVLHEIMHKNGEATERVLLVGAGQAADMLIREIHRTPSLNVKVVGLVDDNLRLRSMTIQGFPILGTIADVPALAKELDIAQIIVAIPSASADQIAHIYRTCKPADLPIKILPSLADLVSGTVSLHDARDLDIKDLLGRPKTEIDLGAISDCIQGHAVLVTGAGGSIGSELCCQMARFGPRKLVLIDHDESALYGLHERLQTLGFTRYVLCPTNILQKRKLEKLFALHRPRLVFHAAAYKHVPLMEMSPDEAVLNNVQGTLLVAEAAARYGVERFVNISTDKAVEPCSVMGATKRAGELIVRMLSDKHPDTLYASVRFGNVLGSQGSVIPVFKSQIESGGPVVITHPEMTRYFMLIEEAVQLVLQAAVMLDENAHDQERDLNTYVLEMGNPVPIVEVAQRMIDYYWQDQSRSIGVEFSGLRPGEKVDEQLVYPHEEAIPSSHPLIKRVCARPGVSLNGHGEHFRDNVRHLIKLAVDREDSRVLIGALMQCVPEYAPLGETPRDRLLLEKSGILV